MKTMRETSAIDGQPFYPGDGAPGVAAPDGIVGESPALHRVLRLVETVATTDAAILIRGETGTGKELIAGLIHRLSARRGAPFVKFNCTAIPAGLLESELFGHERGAFTGAIARRIGRFELANKGTLLLDEIGELPLELQPKLLRVLESGRLRRVGGGGEIAVRVRVVAMTLRDLAGEVARGAFRADLYYRLAGFHLALPPLRQRAADIPQLALHFLREIEPELGRRELGATALQALGAADWPGNVRELRNVIRRAAIVTQDRPDGRIDAADLDLQTPRPFRFGDAALASGPRAADDVPAAPARLPDDALLLEGRTFDDIERQILSWALRRNGGSRRRAARALAIARSTFCDKVKRFGIG